MTEKPPWRVAIEQFERSIGAPLEEFIKTDQFADLAANAAKGQTQVQHHVAVGANQWMQAMGLPTATDISELRAEIAELRAEIADLRKSVGAEARKAKSTAAGKPTETAKSTPAAKPTETAKAPKAATATPAAKPAEPNGAAKATKPRTKAE